MTGKALRVAPWLCAAALLGCGGSHRPAPDGAIPEDGGADGAWTEDGGPADGGVEPVIWEPLTGVEPRDLTGLSRAVRGSDDRVFFCPGSLQGATAPYVFDATAEQWRRVTDYDAYYDRTRKPACPHGAPQPDGSVLWAGGGATHQWYTEFGRAFWAPEEPIGMERPELRMRALRESAAGDYYEPGPYLQVGRGLEAAASLPDGTLVLSGGLVPRRRAPSPPVEWVFEPTAEVERFVPERDAFESLAPMGQARWGHRLLALPGGRLLALGGYSEPPWNDDNETTRLEPIASVELYDPASGRWREVAPMPEGRALMAAAVLPSGKVLVAAGFGPGQQLVADAWLYDPEADRWEATEPIPQPVVLMGEAQLRDGSLLLAGGTVGIHRYELSDGRPVTEPEATAVVQRYREGAGWSLPVALPEPVYAPAVVQLTDGRVLVAGGMVPRSTSESFTIWPPPPVISDRPL